VIDGAVQERLSRLRALAAKMEESIAVGEKVLKDRSRGMLLKQKRELLQRWPEAERRLAGLADEAIGETGRNRFLERAGDRLSPGAGDYVATIQALDRESADAGTAWLQSVVDTVESLALDALPSFRG